VVCGSAFNLALSEIKGMVQMWGIYTTNKETHNNTCIFYIKFFYLDHQELALLFLTAEKFL
jgi:hypothetical protein